MSTRDATSQDLQDIRSVETAAWDDHAATSDQIRSRINKFPEGNPVYVNKQGKIIGYGSTMILKSLPEGNFTWYQITSNGTIAAHVPRGQTLYGVSASVSPGENEHVLKHLIDHCSKAGSARGCKYLVLGSRVPGFAEWSTKTIFGNMATYLALKTGSTDSIDPLLRHFQYLGFDILKAMQNYYPDAKSNNHGVLIGKKI